MNQIEQFDALLKGDAPFLALAPMQDVTDGAFWKLMHRYGGADVVLILERNQINRPSFPARRRRLGVITHVGPRVDWRLVDPDRLRCGVGAIGHATFVCGRAR
jgi:hypothetical protein